MTLQEQLTSLAATRGVRRCAVASQDGFVIDAAEAETGGAERGSAESVAGQVAAALAAGQSLADLFGDGELRQATIEYEHGPVVLVPLPAPAEGHVVVAVLDDAASLGRARLALRRSLATLAEAVAS
ncbi:MAG: roadblock/LC7 domain-containing protein [Trueperaceae bacterium]